MLQIHALSGSSDHVANGVATSREIVYVDAGLQRAALQFERVVDKAVVYILRDRTIARHIGFDIAFDDTVYAQTRGTTFVRVSIHPGKHRITSINPADGTYKSIVLTVGIGELIFLEQFVAMGWRGLWHEMRSLSSDAAKPRISRCRMIQTTAVGNRSDDYVKVLNED